MSYSSKPISYWKEHSPVATASNGQLSTGQLAAIRGVGNSQAINFDKACQHLFNCEPRELNWQAASSFLDWLKSQPRQFHPPHELNFCPEPGCYQLQALSGVAASCSNGHFFTVEEQEKAGAA